MSANTPKPSCSEHKHATEVFPKETAESLWLKIGWINIRTRHRLIRSLGKTLKEDGIKDFDEWRIMLWVLLQALGEVLKRLWESATGKKPSTKPPISSLPKQTVQKLVVKIANLHYEDYPIIFEGIRKTLERSNNERTLAERESLLYATRIAKEIRKLCKPHMENSN